MYLQSVHLTRLLSRLMTVKSLQSEWLNTELFSAECGSTLKPCRVASANLVLYPTIIPALEAKLRFHVSLPCGNTRGMSWTLGDVIHAPSDVIEKGLHQLKHVSGSVV